MLRVKRRKIFVLLGIVWGAFATFAAWAPSSFSSDNQKESVLYLDELDLSVAVAGWGTTQGRASIDGVPLKVGGRVFERGVGHHAQGYIGVRLPAAQGVRFRAFVGLNDSTGDAGRVQFRALADGREIWSSGYLKKGEPGVEADVDLSGVRELVLVLDKGEEGYIADHGDWCDARFVLPNDALKTEIATFRVFADDTGTIIPDEEWARAFFALQKEIATGTPSKVAETAANVAATILPTDRDPFEVVLRRTFALIDSFENDGDGELVAADKEALVKLAERAASVPIEKSAERRELFRDAFDLNRAVALKNPLLNFQDVLFVKRAYLSGGETTGNHMCDQFFGFHSTPGGGLFLLKNAFSENPQVVNLLEKSVVSNGRLKGTKLDSTWGFVSPKLSFDGKTVYFAAADTKSPRHSYEWTQDNCYHLFRVGVDGSNLTQITDGAYDDFDPCPTPSGRIAFISTRRGGYGRCHMRPVPSFTLYSANDDGSDIVPLSVHETNEWAPEVDRNGMLVYTRWDYVDRGHNQAHHPWITFPDGRDPRAIQGNYDAVESSRPCFEASLKQVPDSPLLVATACGHHSQIFGSIILIDPTAADEDEGGTAMNPIRRVTPEQLFPESEIACHGPPHVYGEPCPLSDRFFLVVYDPFSSSENGASNRYGVYLIDVFGNRTLLYRDPNISCQYPTALLERETPPTIPHQTLVGIPPREKVNFNVPDELPKTATVGVANVYATNRPFPEGTKIKELRIVQILPKTTIKANVPWIGFAAENGARRVLGTVPVEEDGSVRFEAPVDVPFYMQALDETGVAVQTMRSATYVHPGETLTCVGCHEGRRNVAQNTLSGNPLAFERTPSTIKPDVPGSNPFNYPTLVQTTLDNRCVDCHQKEAEEGRTFPLGRGDGTQYFLESYVNLRPYVYVLGNNDAQPGPPITSVPTNGAAWNRYTVGRVMPGEFGANRSPLWTLLKNGHYDVELTPTEKRSLALWLDNNCDFFGAYEEETLDAQRRGEAVEPTLE